MSYRLAADAVLLLHLAFILTVIFGGLLVMRRWDWIWLHLPVLAWGAGVELVGGICPLTTIENTLRRLAGGAGYPGGFVEHYIVPIIYPEALTRGAQVALAAAVLAFNALVYARILVRRCRGRPGNEEDRR